MNFKCKELLRNHATLNTFSFPDQHGCPKGQRRPHVPLTYWDAVSAPKTNARRKFSPRIRIPSQIVAENYRLVRFCEAAAADAFGGGTGCFPASAAAIFCASGERFPLLTSPFAK